MDRELTLTVKPYDDVSADAIFPILFRTNVEREDGLTEIPAASYQLVISALEQMTWESFGEDRATLRRAISVVDFLRDMQKGREYRREH